MSSISVTNGAVVEVISAYAAAQQVIAAAASAPAWNVIGAFYMPMGAPVKLELIGLVSIAGRVLTARLYNVTDAAAVSGSTTPDIDGTTDERQVSGAFELPGGKLYQMQAQCIGASGNGTVRSAQLVSA